MTPPPPTSAAAAASPSNAAARALYDVGLEHLKARRHHEAVEALRQAARLVPNEADFRAALGWALFRQAPADARAGRAAVAELRRALQLDERHRAAAQHLAEIYAQTGPAGPGRPGAGTPAGHRSRPPPKLPKSFTGCERSSAATVTAVAPPCATDRDGAATSVSWCPRRTTKIRGISWVGAAFRAIARVSRHAVCSIARA